MTNKSEIQGNQNIVIQGVTDSSITVNVNGETQEIKNELVELKGLLEKMQVQNFQFAQYKYNIEDLDETNFGFVTQKKTFNQLLTRRLIEALQPHSNPASRLLEQATKIAADWESQTRISDKAKEIIAYSFVGVLGIQLQRLMAIGKEDLSEAKQRKYIENCLLTVKRILQLFCFALISKLWDDCNKKKKKISAEQSKILSTFFMGDFPIDVKGYVEILQTLYLIFDEHKLEFPIDEFELFKTHIKEDSGFLKACVAFQDLNVKLDKSIISLLDCFEAEIQLTVILESVIFLAEYDMVSIKNISYDEMRNSPPRYLHNYAALGIDSKSNMNSERVNYSEKPISTDAILLYKDEYQKNVNLFPFIIDYNALTFEEGAKICFYECNHDSGKDLEYRLLRDDSVQYISNSETLKKADNDYNELMKDVDKRRLIKLDNVFIKFLEAKTAILGASELNLDNLFDGEEDK